MIEVCNLQESELFTTAACALVVPAEERSPDLPPGQAALAKDNPYGSWNSRITVLAADAHSSGLISASLLRSSLRSSLQLIARQHSPGKVILWNLGLGPTLKAWERHRLLALEVLSWLRSVGEGWTVVLSSDETAEVAAMARTLHRGLDRCPSQHSLLPGTLYCPHCGRFQEQIVERSGPLSGKTLKNTYVVLDRAGKGSFGDVYLAARADGYADTLLAVKLWNPASNLLLTSEDAKKLFLREIRSAFSLVHQNICAIHDYHYGGEEESFIVMEYASGMTLEELENEEGEALWTNEMIVSLLAQILKGLDLAHRHGVVHRDIKPANIMISADHAGLLVKILDFGISKIAGETTILATGTTAGSPRYMSPEQLAGSKDLDHRSDLYSVGRMLIEVLTGAVPPRDAQDLERFLAPERRVFAPLLERLLAWEPQDRFSSARQALEALSEAMSEGDTELSSPQQALSAPPSPPCLATSPDGRFLARTKGTTLIVHELPHLRVLLSLNLPAPLVSLHFVPQDRLLVAQTGRGDCLVWNTLTWEERALDEEGGEG